MPVYTVQQGDQLSGIADRNGFRKFSTIWDHPNNADLKNKRKNPHILMPGDQLFIPDKEQKKEDRPTGQTHKFVIPIEHLKLKVILLDLNGDPRPNLQCTLKVETATDSVTTGDEGSFEKEILKTAKEGSLKLPEFDLPVNIGYINPVEEFSGQMARLNNLGYDAGEANDPDDQKFRSAVEEFQCDQKMKVTGVCDDATQAKLKSVHGC